jgi:small subunit ribosomal protein S6
LRYYETLFIVHPNYEQERLNSVIKMVEGHIAEIGGHVLAVDDWGKRRLAYPIEKQKSGNYVLIYFEAEPSAVVELQTWFELQAQILAQLVVRLDEKPAGVPSHHDDDDEEDPDEIIDKSSADDESDEDYDEDEDEIEDEDEEKEDDSGVMSEENVKETV